jgi:hypothetical protein
VGEDECQSLPGEPESGVLFQSFDELTAPGWALESADRLKVIGDWIDGFRVSLQEASPCGQDTDPARLCGC